MPAAIHTDVVITIDKKTGHIDITAASNRLTFFKFEKENEQSKRILLATIPDCRMTRWMERNMVGSKRVELRLRAVQAKR